MAAELLNWATLFEYTPYTSHHQPDNRRLLILPGAGEFQLRRLILYSNWIRSVKCLGLETNVYISYDSS